MEASCALFMVELYILSQSAQEKPCKLVNIIVSLLYAVKRRWSNKILYSTEKVRTNVHSFYSGSPKRV